MSGPTPFHIFTAIHKEKKNQKEKTDCYAQIPTLRSSRRGDISIESRKGTFLRSLDRRVAASRERAAPIATTGRSHPHPPDSSRVPFT